MRIPLVTLYIPGQLVEVRIVLSTKQAAESFAWASDFDTIACSRIRHTNARREKAKTLRTGTRRSALHYAEKLRTVVDSNLTDKRFDRHLCVWRAACNVAAELVVNRANGRCNVQLKRCIGGQCEADGTGGTAEGIAAGRIERTLEGDSAGSRLERRMPLQRSLLHPHRCRVSVHRHLPANALHLDKTGSGIRLHVGRCWRGDIKVDMLLHVAVLLLRQAPGNVNGVPALAEGHGHIGSVAIAAILRGRHCHSAVAAAGNVNRAGIVINHQRRRSLNRKAL